MTSTRPLPNEHPGRRPYAVTIFICWRRTRIAIGVTPAAKEAGVVRAFSQERGRRTVGTA
jgi:hypothetical protein